MTFRAKLRRWHMWLGWLVGLPVLIWTVSGFIMVARPIEEVRGTALIRDKGSIGGPVGVKLPALEHWDFRSLTLESRVGGPRWIMVLSDGTALLFDPATGQRLPHVSAADAAREVAVRYTGDARIVSVTRLGVGEAPIEYRGTSPTWLVRMSDRTHFYVDAGSGEIVARRTRFWRVYDFMWGLHIMDLQGRKQTHNPWVVTFSLLAVVMTLMALVLLPLATKSGSRIKPR
jgi:hypothetical protein